jgi:hypothetical protein
MASKALCCTADQDERTSSPDLPSARIVNATPAKQPLLAKRAGTPNSQFTSARSQDLHELQQIFSHAGEPGLRESLPAEPKRLLRPSIYSLHTVHKIKSVHAFLKKQMSKNQTKAATYDTAGDHPPNKRSGSADLDAVMKTPIQGPKLQLKITKADLRKDLLSDKKPEDGGYDPDAEILDDIAQQMGRKAISKRPSVRSIDWTSAPGRSVTVNILATFRGI